MLPYFVASEHNLFAKSAYVYLQAMQELPDTHPDIQKRFEEGYHVVRRSERYWAGLSTDLIIEQVLMRSVKTSGGLTRGKGMTEIQRLVWLMSMPLCVGVNDAMQELTGITYETSEQHKEIGKVRQERDVTDTLKLLSNLKDKNPFSDDLTVRSIAHGVVADAPGKRGRNRRFKIHGWARCAGVYIPEFKPSSFPWSEIIHQNQWSICPC